MTRSIVDYFAWFIVSYTIVTAYAAKSGVIPGLISVRDFHMEATFVVTSVIVTLGSMVIVRIITRLL